MLDDRERALQAAGLFAATFAGRTDAYSAWTGQDWRAVRRPLTDTVILAAFESKLPVSGYILRADNTTHVVALDIDRDDGLALGKLFLSHVRGLGGIAYLEPSRRGCHVWMVLDAVLPGLQARQGLRALIKEAGLPDDPKVELRPGSDRHSSPEGLGHCLRLPTMPHQRTGIRYPLYDSGGEKLPGKLVDLMAAIEYMPAGIVEDAAMRGPLPKTGPPPREIRHPLGDPVNNDSASDILRDLWNAVNAAPGKAIRCPAHDDSHPSLSILRDDQRAICRSPSCILNNNDRGRGTHELRTMAPVRA